MAMRLHVRHRKPESRNRPAAAFSSKLGTIALVSKTCLLFRVVCFSGGVGRAAELESAAVRTEAVHAHQLRTAHAAARGSDSCSDFGRKKSMFTKETAKASYVGRAFSRDGLASAGPARLLESIVFQPILIESARDGFRIYHIPILRIG